MLWHSLWIMCNYKQDYLAYQGLSCVTARKNWICMHLLFTIIFIFYQKWLNWILPCVHFSCCKHCYRCFYCRFCCVFLCGCTWLNHPVMVKHWLMLRMELLSVSCLPFPVGSFVLSGEGLCFPSASSARLRGAHWMDDCLLNERLAYMSAYLLFQTLACQSNKPSRDITCLSFFICFCISALLTNFQLLAVKWMYFVYNFSQVTLNFWKVVYV